MKPSGMIFEHNKIPFTSLDLCCIIEACRELGVKSLRYGELELEFHESRPKAPLESTETSNPPGEAIPAAPEKQESIEKEAVEKEELDFREDEVATATIENPALAEKLILDGELEDDDESIDDSADE